MLHEDADRVGCDVLGMVSNSAVPEHDQKMELPKFVEPLTACDHVPSALCVTYPSDDNKTQFPAVKLGFRPEADGIPVAEYS